MAAPPVTARSRREPPRPEEEILNAALRLLAARSRGVEELRGRLLKKGFPPRKIADCLSWLEERDLLDDEAFSRAFVRDRLRLSPRGAGILRQELMRKGIARDTAQKAVEGVLEEEGVWEGHLAEEVARSWVRKQGPAIRRALREPRFSQEREKARRRLYGYLVRRGFRGDAAGRGLEAGMDEARNINPDNTL